MTGTALLAILMLLAGVVAAVPVAAILAIVILLIEVVRRGLGPERAPRSPIHAGAVPAPDDVGRGDPGDDRGLEPEEPAPRLAPAADGASSGVAVRERELEIGDGRARSCATPGRSRRSSG